MAETLVKNLEVVYNKWAEKGPYGSSSGKPQTTDANSADYEKVIATGRNSWREKFKNVGPPPQRSDTYQRRGRKRRDGDENYIFQSSSSTTSTLASFKVTPIVMPQDERSRRPYMGRCCACMPTSKLENHKEGVENEPLQNILRVHTMQKRNGLWTRTFYHTAFVLQRNVSHKYPDVTLEVLTSPRVIDAVQKSALRDLGVESQDEVDQKSLQSAMTAHRKRAKRAIKQMRAKISNSLIRFTGWFLHKLLGRLYSSIVVHSGQLKVLDTVSKRELPIIFLPTHQSHMDYILLTFILFNYDIRAPHVAAGDNLRIPLFGHLMRGLGGYFIRRRLDGPKGKKDLVYRALLHTYMEDLLREGEFFEIFIEGGRTRTGKALYPKGGLLSVVVDSYLTGAISDAYIAPVSFSYEKLIDGNFTSELRGLPKHQETFWRACSAIWHVIWGKFGNVRVDFGQPFSLKEYLTVCQSQLTGQEEAPFSPLPMQRSSNSSQSLFSEMASDDHRLAVQTLALHVIHTCVNLRAIMSTHLVAFLLLTKHRQGASLDKLSADFEWLVDELANRGRDVGFSGEHHDIVLHACELLGEHLVTVKAKEGVKKRHHGDQNNNPSALFVQPVTNIHQTMELSYYANGVVPDFALDSILALCVISELEAQDWPAMYNSDKKPVLKKSELVVAATHLIHLLHVEFVLKPPCGSLDVIIESAIDRFLIWEIISVDAESTSAEKQWTERFSRTIDCQSDEEDEEERVPDTIYMIETDRLALSRLRFLHSVLAPLMETYYVVILEATYLVSTPKTEVDFIKSTHNILLDRVKAKVAACVESSNVMTVKTAVQALKQLLLVDTREVQPGSVEKELYTSNDSCEHLQRLLDLLITYNPHPLGPPKSLLPLSA